MKRFIALILILVPGLAGFTQEVPDSAKLRIKDVSVLKMVDTLEYYTEDTALATRKVNGGSLSFLLSEQTFTNWLAGGENAIIGIGRVRFYSNRRKDKKYFGHTLDAGLGYVGEGGEIRKTQDRFDYYFKYSRYLNKKFYLSLMLNFKTQLLPGYNYPNDSVVISNFMAPGYLMLKYGVDYMPNRKIKIFFAPVSSKITIVADQTLANAGAFGVIQGLFDELTETFQTLGQNLRWEFGGFLVLSYRGELTKFLRLETELDLFSNYGNNPQNIDVDWELDATFKISKVFALSFESHLIYDNDINMEVDQDGTVIKGPRVQFRQLLGLEITYRF